MRIWEQDKIKKYCLLLQINENHVTAMGGERDGQQQLGQTREQTPSQGAGTNIKSRQREPQTSYEEADTLW